MMLYYVWNNFFKGEKMERLTERKWTSEDNTQPTVVLERCAHCGGMPQFHSDSLTRMEQLVCHGCGMATPFFYLRTQAVAVWNRRVNGRTD